MFNDICFRQSTGDFIYLYAPVVSEESSDIWDSAFPTPSLCGQHYVDETKRLFVEALYSDLENVSWVDEPAVAFRPRSRPSFWNLFHLCVPKRPSSPPASVVLRG